MAALYFVLYFILAGALVFLSNKLGQYIDLLDKKTKVSGAFLGGVLLAAVTSLPELFTSFSSIILFNEKELVIGNVLGSNLFNVLVLGGCLIIFFNTFRKSKIDYKSHFSTFLGLGIIYGLMCYGTFVPREFQPQPESWPINFICVFILITYGLIVFFQPKQEEKEEEEKEDVSPLSVKQIVIRFTICATLLVGISILITYVTTLLQDELHLDATFAGALFLAIATSLPELVSCATLCKKGNFNAAFGDILGSCLFNFCIIGLGELISFDGSLLSQVIYNGTALKDQAVYDAVKMTILAIITLVFIFILLIVKKNISDKKPNEKLTWFNVLTIIIGLIATSGYLIYLAI